MHVLITGASKGIGLALADVYAMHHKDVKLSMCSRNLGELHAAASHIGARELLLERCDVSNEANVEDFVAEAEGRFGPVDHLINNAGFGIFRPIEELTIDEFDSVLATDLRGVFLVTKAVLPAMMAAERGTVVTISSLAGKNGFAGGTAYCAAKFAVRGLMQSMFLEVREKNVRAITVFPGSVDTAFFNPALGATRLRATSALNAKDVADAVYHAAMLPQSATISELDIRPTNPKAVGR
jgi:NADP-dependent 3-hydroxy acid dehydrogenase YdfG